MSGPRLVDHFQGMNNPSEHASKPLQLDVRQVDTEALIGSAEA